MDGSRTPDSRSDLLAGAVEEEGEDMEHQQQRTGGTTRTRGGNANDNRAESACQRQRRRRRPRILLGVTGSVAAVKGPEIASRLASDIDDVAGGIGADVKVVLTRGGRNFFDEKSKRYDPESWKRMEEILSRQRIGDNDDDGGGGGRSRPSLTIIGK